MAQVVTVRLVDDLDGGSADETIEFSIDNTNYEIDLTTTNADKLRAMLAAYVTAASKTAVRQCTGRGAATGTLRSLATASREQNQAIRAWARKQGMQVSDRGRIPQSVINTFHETA